MIVTFEDGGPPEDWILESGDERISVIRAVMTGEETQLIAEWLLRRANAKVREDRAAAKSKPTYGVSRMNGAYRAWREAEILRDGVMESAARYAMPFPESVQRRIDEAAELETILARANERAEPLPYISFEIHAGAPEVLDVDRILGDSR